MEVAGGATCMFLIVYTIDFDMCVAAAQKWRISHRMPRSGSGRGHIVRDGPVWVMSVCLSVCVYVYVCGYVCLCVCVCVCVCV